MHILHINSEFPPVVGGGSVEAHLLYREIAREHRVTVLTPTVKGGLREQTMDNIRVIRVPVCRPWSSAGHVSHLSLLTFLPSLVLQGWLRRAALCDVDIINAWFAIPTGVISPFVARTLKCPAVLTLCGGDIYDPLKKMAPNRNLFTRAAARFALRHHDAVTAISSDLAVRATRDIGCDKPISVIPMGICRKEIGISPFRESPAPFRFVTACRLVERKGLLSVIEAMGRLKSKDFIFHIVGEGPQREALESMAFKLGIAGKIRFEGFLSDEKKEALFQNADGFILCSYHEGQCQAILEGAFHGLPILAGNVGGHTAMIENGKSGLLVVPGDTDAIAGAITRILEEPELRKQMRERILTVVKAYEIERTARCYLELFEATKRRGKR